MNFHRRDLDSIRAKRARERGRKWYVLAPAGVSPPAPGTGFTDCPAGCHWLHPGTPRSGARSKPGPKRRDGCAQGVSNSLGQRRSLRKAPSFLTR